VNRTELRQAIRRHELEIVLQRLQRPRLLEVGGADGYHAHLLLQAGFDVASVDVDPHPIYFPVKQCESYTLPYADGSFDSIFSSQLLNMLRSPKAMLNEMHRVTRTGGVSVHLVPTPAWCLSTFLLFYPQLMVRLYRRLQCSSNNPARVTIQTSTSKGTSLTKLLKYVITVLRPKPLCPWRTIRQEYHLFHDACWRELFTQSGWQVRQSIPTGIWYTGHSILTTSLDLRLRIAQLFGSASRAYILEKVGL